MLATTCATAFFFPTWASPEFHYLSNEITQFTSSPRRQLTYYSISSIEPVTQGPLTPQHTNSSLNKPSKDSIPITHIAEETTTANVPDL
jgi:hypothetical protein